MCENERRCSSCLYDMQCKYLIMYNSYYQKDIYFALKNEQSTNNLFSRLNIADNSTKFCLGLCNFVFIFNVNEDVSQKRCELVTLNVLLMLPIITNVFAKMHVMQSDIKDCSCRTFFCKISPAHIIRSEEQQPQKKQKSVSYISCSADNNGKNMCSSLNLIAHNSRLIDFLAA